jgi:hypothetical protein
MEQLALFAIPRVIGGGDDELDSDKPAMHQAEQDPSQADQRSDTSRGKLEWVPDPPLHIAAFSGDFDEVEQLILDGADIGATGETWGTALSAAELGGNPQVVSLLRNLSSPQSQEKAADDNAYIERSKYPGMFRYLT